MLDEHAILKERVAGKSVVRIARDNGCTEGAIEVILDQHAGALLTDKFLRRALALELARLDEYVETFHAKALAGDAVAGALCVKISERRSTLLGLNATQGVAVQVIHRTEPEKPMTRAEEIDEIIDRVRGKLPGSGASN